MKMKACVYSSLDRFMIDFIISFQNEIFKKKETVIARFYILTSHVLLVQYFDKE